MRLRRLFAPLALLLASSLAQAAVGVALVPMPGSEDPITVFYPSSSPARAVERGPFKFQLAEGGTPVRGNGRLIVVSHGSGGSPWTYTDLASRLVEAGFVVAAPLHDGDNWKDMGKVGPPTWRQRPHEVSRTVDAIAADARFASLLSLDKVGGYGMSAGGHTMLTLAGGRWSPSQLLKHCEAHLDDDFPTCVGLATRLRGNALDGLRKGISRMVLRWRLDDSNWYSHHDPRITAVIAEVPFAADFDMASLAKPKSTLGIVQAGQDQWLAPRYHSNQVIKACAGCEVVADVPTAGHGSFLSPPPARQYLSDTAWELLRDPPGFDRALVAPTHDKAVAFFRRQLLN